MSGWIYINKQKILLVSATTLCISLLVGLFLFLYLSTFTRIILDDFCMGQTLVEKGFWESQKWWYVNWDGRYTFTFLIHLSVWAGPLLHRFAPSLVAIMFTLFCFGNIYYSLPRKMGAVEKFISASLGASAITFFTFKLVPDVSESFYWVSAMFTYYLPITLFLGGILSINILSRSKDIKWYHYTIVAGFFIASSGSSETFSLVQLFILFSILVLVYLVKPKGFMRLRNIILVAAISAFVGTVIMIIAPGNKIRQSYFPPKPPIQTAIDVSIDKSVRFITDLVLDNKYSILTIMFIGFIMGLLSRMRMKNNLYVFLILSLIVYLVVFISFIASIYVTGTDPPNRVLIIPTLFTILTVIALGFMVGLKFNSSKKEYFVKSLLVAVIILTPVLIYKSVLPTVGYLRSDIKGYKEYSRSFDAFNEEMINTSGRRVDIIRKKFYAVNGHQAAQLDDPGHWINKCISGYYQIKSIRFK